MTKILCMYAHIILVLVYHLRLKIIIVIIFMVVVTIVIILNVIIMIAIILTFVIIIFINRILVLFCSWKFIISYLNMVFVSKPPYLKFAFHSFSMTHFFVTVLWLGIISRTLKRELSKICPNWKICKLECECVWKLVCVDKYTFWSACKRENIIIVWRYILKLCENMHTHYIASVL